MLEGSAEGGGEENDLWVETVGKIYCINITFQCFFKVDKFLIFMNLPIKCIVIYFTDVVISLTPMPSMNFNFLRKK